MDKRSFSDLDPARKRTLRPIFLLLPVTALVALLGGLVVGTGNTPVQSASVAGVAIMEGGRGSLPATTAAGRPATPPKAATLPNRTPAAHSLAAQSPAAPIRGAAAPTTRARPVTRAGAARPAPVSRPARRPASPTTTRVVPASPPAPIATSAPPSACATSIANVESRGLYPAPGFTVTCPGYALGHMGMTCYNTAGVCPGAKEIVIATPRLFVVANEFENSRIFLGLAVRCHTLDCGSAAYGF